MTISYSPFDIKKTTKYPGFDRNCTLRDTLSLKSASFSYVKYSDIPSCWPRSQNVLSLVKAPLTDFESNISEPIVWPSNLTLLRIKTYYFTKIASRVFKNAPANLSKIVITECKKPFHKFFSSWPTAGAVKSIYFRNCHLNSTKSSDFINLQQLEFLDLSENDFTTVPTGLPSSLQTLYLVKNSLEYINADAWMNLNNLRTLNIQQNKLRYVPTNLPRVLEKLIISDNMIEFIDSAALAHLTNLQQLNLAKNR